MKSKNLKGELDEKKESGSTSVASPLIVDEKGTRIDESVTTQRELSKKRQVTRSRSPIDQSPRSRSRTPPGKDNELPVETQSQPLPTRTSGRRPQPRQYTHPLLAHHVKIVSSTLNHLIEAANKMAISDDEESL